MTNKVLVLGNAWRNTDEARVNPAKAVCDEYEITQEKIDEYDLLVAAYWSGCYAGQGWLLLREKSSGALFEVNAEHCSCYELEGQFDPKPTTLTYLRSPMFPIIKDDHYCDVTTEDKKAISEFLATL